MCSFFFLNLIFNHLSFLVSTNSLSLSLSLWGHGFLVLVLILSFGWFWVSYLWLVSVISGVGFDLSLIFLWQWVQVVVFGLEFWLVLGIELSRCSWFRWSVKLGFDNWWLQFQLVLGVPMGVVSVGFGCSMSGDFFFFFLFSRWVLGILLVVVLVL